MKNELKVSMERQLKIKYGVSIEEASKGEIFSSLSSALMETIIDNWNNTNKIYSKGKQAYYLSAEYLMGRAL